MSTTLVSVTGRKKGTSAKRLNLQQQSFINELLADPTFNGTRAAERAGYSQPSVAAVKLLKNPLIQAEVDKRVSERQERLKVCGDDILDILHTVLFLNPFRFFKVGRNGAWVVDHPENIPDQIGRVVTHVTCKNYQNPDGGVETEWEVHLMSKDYCLQLAMRHHRLLETTDSRTRGGMDANTYKALLDRLQEPEQVVDGKVVEREARATNGKANATPKR